MSGELPHPVSTDSASVRSVSLPGSTPARWLRCWAEALPVLCGLSPGIMIRDPCEVAGVREVWGVSRPWAEGSEMSMRCRWLFSV